MNIKSSEFSVVTASWQIGRGIRLLLRIAAVLAQFTVTAWCAAALAAQPYILGVGDKVEVMVFERTELSGEFTIRPPGELSMPVVGVVSTVGLTLAELEKQIGERLAKVLIADSPHVSVQLAGYRPYFTLGDVKNPGEYPYVPGLTVMRSIAKAGGFASASSDTRLEEARLLEEMNRLVEGFRVDVAREARLLAEQQGLSEIAFPDHLLADSNDRKIVDIVHGEIGIFDTRRAALDGEFALFQKRIGQYQIQRKSLSEEMANAKKRHRLLLDTFNERKSLVVKGALSRSELLSTELSVNEAERTLIDIAALIAETEQNVIGLEQSIANSEADWSKEIAVELKEVQERMVQTEVGVGGTLDQLRLVAGGSARDLGDPDAADEFLIRRGDGENATTSKVSLHTAVLPGDVVVVPYRKSRQVLPLPSRVEASELPDLVGKPKR